ncbi:hypothetical protein HY485_03710 [Candidatus Woesearchaeota archaeon]|nr:hypothetical protein [Candidatus Woesearchaeota archaeon]
MSLENDISCLYAAKNFAPHLQLRQPEPVQQSPFLTKLTEIIEKYGKEAWNKIKAREQELRTLEEGTDEEAEQMQSIILGYCKKACEKLETEITKKYEQLRKQGKITPEDKQTYHQFMAETSPEYVFQMASGFAQEEGQQNLPEREKQARQQSQDWAKEQNKKHEDYLATAGINTEEGKIAWTVAHSAAYHFSQRIYFKDEHEGKQQDRLRFATETTIKQEELEAMVLPAIYGGLLTAESNAIITNKDKFHEKTTEWLSKEIKDRLSQGIEFNLLDAVYVKKLSDGQIELKVDKREIY